MRNATLAALLSMACIHAAAGSELDEKIWNHGSADCSTNRDPAIELFRFDASTYILRQNKCLSFEAPFIYVLVGERQVFVQDTGATADPAQFPLYELIRGRIAKTLPLVVTHSHSHSDHTAADAQFRGKPGVTLIEPEAAAVREYFGLRQWPEQTAKLDLGGRSLVIVPIPGHQDESIAVYDSHTGWLLSGDTLYPGTIYVRNWQEYRSSIRRLADFARSHRIAAILGTHIEMSRTGVLFPVGSTFQPDEAPLPLSAADLLRLNDRLQQDGGKSAAIAMDNFTVAPLSTFQRAISNVAKWLGIR